MPVALFYGEWPSEGRHQSLVLVVAILGSAKGANTAATADGGREGLEEPSFDFKEMPPPRPPPMRCTYTYRCKCKCWQLSRLAAAPPPMHSTRAFEVIQRSLPSFSFSRISANRIRRKRGRGVRSSAFPLLLVNRIALIKMGVVGKATISEN